MKKYYIHRDGLFPAGPDYDGLEKYVAIIEDDNLYAFHNNGKIERLGPSTIYDFIKSGEWVEISEKFASTLLKLFAPSVTAVSATTKPNYNDKLLTDAFRRIANKTKVEKKDEKSPLLFRHIRKYHPNGEIAGSGGATVGIIINYTKQFMEIYPAVCLDTDIFNKQLGRNIASIRHEHGFGVTVPYDDTMTLNSNITNWCNFNEDDLVDNSLSKELKKFTLDIANTFSNKFRK